MLDDLPDRGQFDTERGFQAAVARRITKPVVVALLRRRLTDEQCADALGVKKRTFSNKRRGFGLPANRLSSPEQGRGVAPSCADALRDLLIGSLTETLRAWRLRDWADLYESGLTYQAIADNSGVPYSAVYEALNDVVESRSRGRVCTGSRALNDAVRGLANYARWRQRVLNASAGRCVWCSRPARDVDHIVPLAALLDECGASACDDLQQGIELAKRHAPIWSARNGRALCMPCHKQTATYGTGERLSGQTSLL